MLFAIHSLCCILETQYLPLLLFCNCYFLFLTANNCRANEKPNKSLIWKMRSVKSQFLDKQKKHFNVIIELVRWMQLGTRCFNISGFDDLNVHLLKDYLFHSLSVRMTVKFAFVQHLKMCTFLTSSKYISLTWIKQQAQHILYLYFCFRTITIFKIMIT